MSGKPPDEDDDGEDTDEGLALMSGRGITAGCCEIGTWGASAAAAAAAAVGFGAGVAAASAGADAPHPIFYDVDEEVLLLFRWLI